MSVHVTIPVGIDAASAKPFDASRLRYVTCYFIGTGTLSAGVVSIETAHLSTYAGTWWPLTTFTATDASPDKVKAVQLAVGAWSWIRFRETTPTAPVGALTLVIEGY